MTALLVSYVAGALLMGSGLGAVCVIRPDVDGTPRWLWWIRLLLVPPLAALIWPVFTLGTFVWASWSYALEDVKQGGVRRQKDVYIKIVTCPCCSNQIHIREET